jgi:hypothetical protein
VPPEAVGSGGLRVVTTSVPPTAPVPLRGAPGLETDALISGASLAMALAHLRLSGRGVPSLLSSSA